MFSYFYALICSAVALISTDPIEDVLLILSFFAVVAVFSTVLVVRAARRRRIDKTK